MTSIDIDITVFHANIELNIFNFKFVAENIESITQEKEDYLGELRNIFEKMPDTTKNELDSSEIVGATQRVSLASRAGELQGACFRYSRNY